MRTYNSKRIQVKVSKDRTNQLLDPEDPLHQFGNQLDAAAPSHALWWPDDPELSIQSLWNCLQAKAAAVQSDTHSLNFEVLQEHVFNIRTGKWETVGQITGLSFPASSEAGEGYVVIEFPTES